MSPEYAAAYAAHNEAHALLRKAQLAYRARQIGDAEYLAARKVEEDALRAFDAAYAAETAA